MELNLLSISVKKGIAEIEIRVPNTTSPTKDMWLLKASRFIWEIWSRMGWITTGENFISPEDWKQPFLGSNKDRVMARSERLIKVMSEEYLDGDTNYEKVVLAIAKLANEIDREDFYLMPSIEASELRKLVVKIMLIGVMKGLNTNSAVEMEHFTDPIQQEFCFDKNYVMGEEDCNFYKTKHAYVNVYTIKTGLTNIPFISVSSV